MQTLEACLLATPLGLLLLDELAHSLGILASVLKSLQRVLERCKDAVNRNPLIHLSWQAMNIQHHLKHTSIMPEFAFDLSSLVMGTSKLHVHLHQDLVMLQQCAKLLPSLLHSCCLSLVFR